MENKEITQIELKRNLNYNPNTGIFKWKINKFANKVKNKIAGYKRKDGYIHIHINNKLYLAHRLAWLYMEGCWPKYIIDHKDGVQWNNKWDNLRHTTQKINTRNRKISKRNKSGVTGIIWESYRNKWLSNIRINGKLFFLGRFKNKDNAVLARWNAEVKYDFPNSNTTSPAYLYLKERNLC